MENIAISTIVGTSSHINLYLLHSPQETILLKRKEYNQAAVGLVKTYGMEWTSVDDIKGVYTKLFGTPQVNT